jgi:hypothetical protein
MIANTLESALGKIEKTNSCWLWLGIIDKRDGYGRFCFKSKKILAHRLIYELLGGTIPEALTLDHLCRNKSCVNPAHLEPVTIGENTRRGLLYRYSSGQQGVLCRKGHTLSAVNWQTGQKKVCQKCHSIANRNRYIKV